MDNVGRDLSRRWLLAALTLASIALPWIIPMSRHVLTIGAIPPEL
jgi:hypothetical protein